MQVLLTGKQEGMLGLKLTWSCTPYPNIVTKHRIPLGPAEKLEGITHSMLISSWKDLRIFPCEFYTPM